MDIQRHYLLDQLDLELLLQLLDQAASEAVSAEASEVGTVVIVADSEAVAVVLEEEVLDTKTDLVAGAASAVALRLLMLLLDLAAGEVVSAADLAVLLVA